MPSSVHSLGSFSLTSVGGRICAAAAAISPNLSVRPLGTWVMTPLCARHSAAGTSQRVPAAASSISRAAAPALRSTCWELRTERLPPVDMFPHARCRRMFSSGATYSVLTLLQSHSSSSATSMGKAVDTPCPISALATRMVTESSGAIRIQALTSAPAASASAGRAPPGISKPSASVPPSAATLVRSDRRSIGIEFTRIQTSCGAGGSETLGPIGCSEKITTARGVRAFYHSGVSRARCHESCATCGEAFLAPSPLHPAAQGDAASRPYKARRDSRVARKVGTRSHAGVLAQFAPEAH